MPTLLQITIDGNLGSTGRIAEAIGEIAIAHGWDSYIAHAILPRPSKSKIIKIGTYFDFLTHALRTRIFDSHGLGSVRATKKLVKKIREIKPDLIHLHNLHGYFVNIEILFDFLSKASIPVTWTFHDCWSFTGHCCHFDFVGCEKWKTECYSCPQKKEYPASYFIDRSRKNFRLKKQLFTSVQNLTIITVSKWLQDIVHSSFLGKIPSQVIYNGVDTDIFSPVDSRSKIRDRYNIKADFMILGVAGVWTRQKGLSDFIELSKRIPGSDQIVIVGLTRSQTKKLPPNIIGITHTENKHELAEIYSAADVYLNLSVEETFGLTTAEALACGTPALVYKATACPEVVDPDTGIVVEKKNIDDLLLALQSIREKGKNAYAAACRDRALLRFNKNDRFAEYVDLFETILKNQNK